MTHSAATLAVRAAPVVLCLLFCSSASAEATPAPPRDVASLTALPVARGEGRDRIAMSGDVIVRRGERVRDAVAMGGDLTIEGEVEGSAVAMGGDLRVRPGGVVHGDATALGGDLSVEPGGSVEGSRVALGGGSGLTLADGGAAGRTGALRDAGSWLSDTAESAARWALLFVLGLVLLGLAPERLSALHRTMLRAPVQALATGVAVAVLGVLATVVLAITILGIPAAVLLGLLLALALYVGLAAAASVVGGVLPVPQLRARPVAQLAAGVAALFVASLVPIAGELLVAVAALYGLGALWRTRFAARSPVDAVPDAGPYRTAAPSAEPT